MAWIQNANPPQNKRLEFNLENFSGGLNNRSSVIEQNQASEVLNMHFTHQDVLEKRLGMELFDGFVTPEPITHLAHYRPYIGDDILIRATNSKVYANDVLIKDVQGEIDSVNYQGLLFFADGDALYAYGTFPTVTGWYLGIVGNIPADHVVLKVKNPPSDYVPLGEIHLQGKTVIDYTAGTIHYEPCEKERLDAYLGSNVLPQFPRFIEIHKGRMFVSGVKNDDDNVFISDTQNPYYYAVGLPIQLPPNSDKIRGMIVYDDCLIVGRSQDVYYIIGDTNNPNYGFSLFELRKLNTHTGIANNKTFDIAHNFLFLLGSDGTAYAISNINVEGRILKTQIISGNIDLFKEPIGATRADLLDASAHFDDEYWYLTIGDRTLVYSYRYQAWTVFDYVDIYAPLRYYDDMIWGRKDGTVAKWSADSYTDNGRPIYALWVSKSFDFEEPTRYKQFREFYMVAHTYDYTNSDVRVTFEIDYSDMYNSIIVENKISYYGIAQYGGRFITRNINASVPFMIGRRARYMRIKIANSFPVQGQVNTFVDLYDVPRKFNYMCFRVMDVGKYFYYENGQWLEVTEEILSQPMRVYKINGDYELKGKR
jgi:hypothetical protein